MASVSPDRQRAVSRWPPLAGVLGPLLFVGLSTLAGLLRPGYSPVREAISALGAGPNAWIQNANFALSGLLFVVFAVDLYPHFRPFFGGGRLFACLAMLALSGVGLTSAAYFTVPGPTDPPSQQLVAGILHGVCFLLVFVPLSLALILVGRPLRAAPGWRGSGIHALVTGWATLALFFVVYALLSVDAPYGGLVLRVMVSVAFSWHVITGWRLFAAGRARRAAR
jgi:hypothetical membrane protein